MQVLALHRDMRLAGVEPDSATLQTVISACEKVGAWEQADQVCAAFPPLLCCLWPVADIIAHQAARFASAFASGAPGTLDCKWSQQSAGLTRVGHVACGMTYAMHQSMLAQGCRECMPIRRMRVHPWVEPMQGCQEG